MHSVVRVLIGTAGLLAGQLPAAAQRGDEPRALQRLRAMAPEAVRAMVSVQDDALETSATLTTREVFREKQGLLGVVPFDVFLRAFINKKTGTTNYQLYATSHYTAPLWTRWTWANYQTPGGPESVKLDVLGRIRGRCERYRGCERFETVAFLVDETLLRGAAAAYRPGEIAPWSFKLKGQNGFERIDGLVAAEIAGLLQAVDAYKAANGLAKGR